MKQDIVVIGAGIIGLATAERLLARGANVTILERNKAGQESSWAGGGILSPLFPWEYSDHVTQLANYSAKQFPAWISVLQQASGIDPEYEISGMLILPPNDSETAMRWCSVRGIEIEQSTVPSILSIGKEGGADSAQIRDRSLFLPNIAQVRNPRLLRALISRVMQLGGRIIENCTACRLNTDRQKIQSITSSCGEFVADYYIVSAGAWSTEILGTQALQLDIKPIKGQMLLFKFNTPPIRNIVVQNELYIIPRRDGHVLIGSTLEDVGFDKRTTISAFNQLLTQARDILPSLQKMSIKRHWSGLRPASPSNVPTIGWHPIIRNLLLNSGHYRYGVTMAPASAEILVNEMTGASQPFDISPYQAGWEIN
ncbi:glycine oxidase ThiO [Nitrosomonas supralitoralis]|uniref:Glycine oxidase ThiO n=1 Tax=Nitrosomonas supralitoralis TaxID=2116706 RepID=A0A2P7NWJ9_9PROT|nr:glycine oxidase ThiO [Nitrosomonas supralitoralis]PSJ17828.1 glycine oxidase ThiO [Nitrosomonas supralitoralis]